MPKKLLAGALSVIAIVAGILWASGHARQPFIPVLALLLFLTAASLFGKTSRFADRLRPLVGNRVRVLAWGAELPGYVGASFSLDKVLALGAGLHIYLRPLPNGLPIHLKVAQPEGAELDDRHVEIQAAKYIQWAGRKVPKVGGQAALVLTFSE
jgi:hypothetical protein